MHEVYSAIRLNAISPRRRYYADVLANYLATHGGKIVLDDRGYVELWRALGLTRGAVDRAAEDLYSTGLADQRPAGLLWVIALRERVGA